MMANLGALVVSLEANIANFTRDMSRASQQTEQTMVRMNNAMDTARNAALALGGAAVVGSIAAMVKHAIEAADNLRDMSMKTGIAVETLNGLGFAAGQAGGSLESMVAAAGKLNRTIADAAGGGKESGAAFKALGISVRDASGELKKADVIMAEVADRFAEYQDGPAKAALAVALFGKSGAEMIPVLNEGGGAMRENIEYAKRYSGATSELSNMADEFNDIMGKLNVQQKGFANTMAQAVLPILNDVAKEILGASENANAFGLAGEVVRTVLETFVVVGSEVAYTFKMIGDEIGGTAAQIGALASGDMQLFKSIGENMRTEQAQALKDHDAFIKKILDRTPATVTPDGAPTTRKGDAPVLASGTKPKTVKTDAQKLDEESKALVKRLKEEEGALGLTGAALLSYTMQQKGMGEAYQAQALRSQTVIDDYKREEEAVKKATEAANKKADERKRFVEQNALNVEQIRRGMLTEVEIEDESHRWQLMQLQTFHGEKLENAVRANALIEAENARHVAAVTSIERARQQDMLSMTSQGTNQLYELMKQASIEKTALGKAMFIATKALAAAEIIVNTEVAAAKAQAQFGAWGTPIAMAIRTMGYASAGMVAGMAVSEASAEGGYDIPGGVNPVTQLHEKEMVLPKAQAEVIRGLASRGGIDFAQGFNQTNNIHIDARSDQEAVHRLVVGAVQQGNADLVDRLQRAGRI